MIDVVLSRAVAAQLRPRPKNKRCFLNALNALCADALAGAGPVYVEGYANGLPHGWVETEDGRIVDVTPSWLATAATGEYRAVRRFTASEVADAKCLPILDLEGMMLMEAVPDAPARSVFRKVGV